MSLLAAVRVALSALLVHKGRAVLTSLGIIIGIGAVTALVSAGDGARYKLDEQLDILGRNLILVRPGSYRQEGSAVLDTLTRADADAIRKEAGSLLVGVTVTQMTFRTVWSPGGNKWFTSLVGTSPQIQEIRGWRVAQGRFFNDDDERKSAPVCLIGQTVRRKLSPNNPDPVGEWIRADHVRLQIIGVVGAKGRALNGADQDDQIFVPISTLQHKLVGEEHVSLILTAARSDDQVEAVKDKIIRILRRQHHTRPGFDDFDVSSVREMVQIAYVFTNTLRLLVAIIASISLVVGGVGIMNIMLVSVTERTREIGIRMAVGATPQAILTQFLLESLVLSGLGGLLGVLLGLAAAVAIARVVDWPVVVSPTLVLIGAAVSAGVGVFFGYYPAWKASRLEPIEALRFD